MLIRHAAGAALHAGRKRIAAEYAVKLFCQDIFRVIFHTKTKFTHFDVFGMYGKIILFLRVILSVS